MVRIGIIGSSSISSKFCDAVNNEKSDGKNIVLQANYSRNLEQAKIFACKHQITDSFDDKLDLFKTIDLVYIATPNKLHFEDVKLALMNNVHVIVEKPMTTTNTQTKQLFELAKANNLLLVEAIKTCTMNTYQHLQANLDTIGEIKSFRLNMMREYDNFPTTDQYPNIYKQVMEGGVINDLGSYALFPLIDFIYPEEDINTIKLQTITNNCGLDVEVEVIASLKSKITNVHGIISLSMVSNDASKSYIYGTKGYVTIDSLSQFNTIKYYDLDDNLSMTVNRSSDHLMQTELLHTIELLETNRLSSSIHNNFKSVLVSSYLEALHNC